MSTCTEVGTDVVYVRGREDKDLIEAEENHKRNTLTAVL